MEFLANYELNETEICYLKKLNYMGSLLMKLMKLWHYNNHHN